MLSKKELYIRLYEYQTRIEYANSTRRRLLKPIMPAIYRRGFPVQTLFIFGFQRSGTTAALHSFKHLFGFKIFEEFSPLSDKGQENLRLNPLSEVRELINKTNTPFIIVKPLVESQRANEILDYFKDSKGIWMYRNYRDVVSSFNKKFGKECNREPLRKIAENDNTNWRTERIPDDLRQLAKSYIDQDLTGDDITALFWHIRNNLYFRFNFDKNDKLPLIRYESWVTAPDEHMRQLLNYINYPSHFRIPKSKIHQESVNKGASVTIRPDIEALCDETLKKFDDCYRLQNPS